MQAPRFATVIATLAVGPGCPAGDPDVTLELLAPLTADAQIDTAGFAVAAAYCGVRRLRAGRPDGSFGLVRLDEGWALRTESAEDGPLWPLDVRLLRPGEYLTVHQPDGAAFTYLVVNVEFPESA